MFLQTKKEACFNFWQFYYFAALSVLFYLCTPSSFFILLDTEIAKLSTLLLLCSCTAPLLQLLLQYLLCSCAGITLHPLACLLFLSFFAPCCFYWTVYQLLFLLLFFPLTLLFSALLQRLFWLYNPVIVLALHFKFLCNRRGEFMMREQNGNYHVILVLFTNIFWSLLLSTFECRRSCIIYGQIFYVVAFQRDGFNFINQNLACAFFLIMLVF